MDKMKLESADITSKNIEKIAELFPNCITETEDENGNLKKAINFDLLKQDLSKDLVDGKECYEFTWVGKKESIIEANRPIRKTLRPCKEESVNWDLTENLYIEGDNLEVLKVLQESYLGKVKMIYIDPPYNTGNDILYKNNFYEDDFEYNEKISKDTEGNIIFVNTETNGRFHSDWCSMMYERISLSRNLLAQNGFFIIAIDHNELFNLGQMCDEIFGFNNRIGVISVVHKPEGRNQAKFIGPSNEFMLIYAKDEKNAKIRKVAIDEEQIALFDQTDDKGRYLKKNFIRLSDGKYATKEAKPDFWYPIFVSEDLSKVSISSFPDAVAVYPTTKTGIDRTWKTVANTFMDRYKNNDICVEKDNDGDIVIYEKLREDQVIKTHWINKKYHGYHYGTKVLDDLLGVKTFDFPKSVFLMKDIIKLFTEKDDVILDYFSGSATTAHATFLQNHEDNYERKFILAQIQEPCDKKSEAFKAGYKNICEIGKERIRRAAKKIAEENPNAKFDGGFRVFKVDDSNMKDVYYAPAEYSQSLLDKLESNIKEDRTDLDLFFGCILDWGLPLNLSYTSETIENCSVHTYSENALIACFNDNIPESVIKEIAKRKPLRVVFRDSSFADTPSKINVTEIFKLLSPDTRVKVI